MRQYLSVLLLLVSTIVFAQSDSLPFGFKKDTGYYTSFDGTRIYYETYGKGKAVVLIHGFIVNSMSWKNTRLFQDLLTNGYKVVLMDLRGNGRSDKPQNEAAYAHDAEARDIMGLVRYLHLGHYDVVGYSRGSIITARLLILDRRVHTAVLGGMGSGFTNPYWPRRILFYSALSGKPIKELQSMVDYVKQQGLDMQVLAYLQKYQPSTSESALGRIKRKVLVISGDKDQDNGSANDLCKMIHNSIFISIPGDHNSASKSREAMRILRNCI